MTVPEGVSEQPWLEDEREEGEDKSRDGRASAGCMHHANPSTIYHGFLPVRSQ